VSQEEVSAVTRRKRKRGGGVGVGTPFGDYNVVAGIAWRKRKKKR
jgi:hypothetical protein